MQYLDQVTRAPAMGWFLGLLTDENLPLSEAMSTPTVFDVLSQVAVKLRPYNPLLETAVREGVMRGSALMGLARKVTSTSAYRTWFEPLDRSSQLVVFETELNVVTANAPPEEGLGYQQPQVATFSSTFDGETSHIQRAIENGINDWVMVAPPLQRALISVDSQAKIYELRGPEDWHHLSMSYPSQSIGAPYSGETVPDWGSVAQDWDGVHLTLGGLITSLHVRCGKSPWSVMWLWDTERTLWLRPRWESVKIMPQLVKFKPSRWEQ